MDLDGALEVLGNMQEVNLATIDGDQPRVRVVTLIPYEDRFWITSRTSARKMDQIRANNRVEINLTVGENIEGDRDFGTVRATGRLKIVDDPTVKKELAGQMPFFDMIFNSVDDPEYTLMKLDLSRIKVLYPYRDEMATFDL